MTVWRLDVGRYSESFENPIASALIETHVVHYCLLPGRRGGDAANSGPRNGKAIQKGTGNSFLVSPRVIPRCAKSPDGRTR